MAIKDLAITSLETITVFDMAGKYLFTLDELQNASIAQGQEKVDITGKQGRKITSLKRNKTVTVSGTNGLVSTGLLQMQAGGDGMVEGSYEILWTDHTMKVVSETESGTTTLKATTQYTPCTGIGDIFEIYVKNSDDSLGKKLVLSTATPGSGEFSISGKEVTFFGGTAAVGTEGNDGYVPAVPADVNDGDILVAYYKREVTSAEQMENLSDSYSEKGQIYIDAIAEDKCANVYHVQYYIPKGDFSGEFELSMGDDQTVQAFEIEALAGGCNGSSAFWTLTVFQD